MEKKNAVIVGKVNLPVRREVVMVKTEVRKAERPTFTPNPEKKQVRRDTRPQDPRTMNLAQLQELQFVKQQLRTKDDIIAQLRGDISTLEMKLKLAQQDLAEAKAPAAP